MEKRRAEHTVDPQSFDKIIIDGEVMGSSIAYHLVKDGFRGRITVLKKILLTKELQRSLVLAESGGNLAQR